MSLGVRYSLVSVEMKYTFLLFTLLVVVWVISERQRDKAILTPHLKIRNQGNILQNTLLWVEVRWLRNKEGLTGKKIEVLYIHSSFGSLPMGW